MENNLEIFDFYFNGQMSVQESVDFEKKLNTNADVKEEYEQYLRIKKAAFDIEKERLRKQLDHIEIKEEDVKQNLENANPKTSFFQLIKWTSAVAAIFVLAFWSYSITNSSDPAALFSQNFEEYSIQQSRGKNSIEELSDKNLNTPELKLHYATSIMKDGQEQEAIKYLIQIPDESALRDQKYWYLGLANLKAGNISESKKYFIQLQKLSNFKKKEIKHILSELK